MQWLNDKRGYGWLSIGLHWLAVVAVIFMLWSGLSAEYAEDASDGPAHSAFMRLHVSIGISAFALMLARVVASYAQARPALIEQAPALNLIAAAAHHLLLLAILIQLVSGPLAIWSTGRSIAVFDLIKLHSPFAHRDQQLHEAAELAHSIGRWMLVGLISVHVLGAFKHAMFNRDGVLQRMFAPAKT